MNEPLKSGWFEVDQMFRFVNSLCSWDQCREPVAAPDVIEVTPFSLYCRDHAGEPDATKNVWFKEVRR
jgi:hypothetical protein